MNTSLLGAVLACAVVGASSCAFGPQYNSDLSDSTTVTVQVINEQGEPIRGAAVSFSDQIETTDRRGSVDLRIDGPVVLTVSSKGTLPEPVAIGPNDHLTTVHLWDRVGADGQTRTSMHFGGDVMLGRRYLDPDRRTPFVDDAASARSVVSDLAPLSSTADWTVVNLETVVGELDPGGALEAKRFLLQSTPFVTEALDEMGVDMVTLGNNHAYDWGESGLDSTFEVLDDAGIDAVGAGTSRAEATRGKLVELDSSTVGILSFTTVNGSFVNDQLPSPDAPVPADLDPTERWQYEERVYGFTLPSGYESVRPQPRRISTVWNIFEELEGQLDPDVENAMWQSMRAVFPELQDWVARRGHGGAAPYRRSEMEDEIKRLRGEGADMVVVQVHGGFQFAEVESAFVKRIAHAAIDAGADAVVAHHPHVLQGVEWYNNKLIVYSLGNLLFDQDFLATFPSAMLRIVTSGSEILEARMLPIMLDKYRPVPVVGTTAQQVVRMIDARTVSTASSARVNQLVVGSVIDTETTTVDANSMASMAVEFVRNSGLITTNRIEYTSTMTATPDAPAVLSACQLIRTDNLQQGVEVGIDLFDWGRFDNDTADGQRNQPLHWKAGSDDESWAISRGATNSPYDDALEIFTSANQKVTVAIAARIDLDAHRVFDPDGRPLDAPATYELLLDVKRKRGEAPIARLVSFWFDDTNPTSNPKTARLNEVRLTIDVPADEKWHSVSLPIPTELTAATEVGLVPNTATLLIDAPPALQATLAIDNVQIIEWRGASVSGTPIWVEGDLVRRTSSAPTEVSVSGCPS
jgi:poly-gamma-glutamate capsule biosynthesis protein CapA/YwtB (metallophosphatase superfamily)